MSGPNDGAGENYDKGRHYVVKAASGHAHLCYDASAVLTRLKQCCRLGCWRVKKSTSLPQQPHPLDACMCPPMTLCGGPSFQRELCIK